MKVKIHLFITIQQHFRRINGTCLNNFEGHLSEVLWRNWHRGASKVEAAFELIKRVYPLDSEPLLYAPHPLFETWDIEGVPGGEVSKKNYCMIFEMLGFKLK